MEVGNLLGKGMVELQAKNKKIKKDNRDSERQ